MLTEHLWFFHSTYIYILLTAHAQKFPHFLYTELDLDHDFFFNLFQVQTLINITKDCLEEKRVTLLGEISFPTLGTPDRNNALNSPKKIKKSIQKLWQFDISFGCDKKMLLCKSKCSNLPIEYSIGPRVFIAPTGLHVPISNIGLRRIAKAKEVGKGEEEEPLRRRQAKICFVRINRFELYCF